MINPNTRLTTGEVIWFARRRRKMNQKQFAREIASAPAWVLGMWERDEACHGWDGVKRYTTEMIAALDNVSWVYNLDPSERLVLERRRAGYSQGEVARSMGVTRQWVNAMEQGDKDATRLRSYWKERGLCRVDVPSSV